MALYVWGSNKVQQLGLNNLESKEVYDVSHVEALEAENITGFAAGKYHSLALNEFGDVFAWGRGKEGQLGIGVRSDDVVSIPKRVSLLEGEMISQVCCGESHSLALTVSGDLFMWGLLPHKRQDTHPGSAEPSMVELAGMAEQAATERQTTTNDRTVIVARMMQDSERMYETRAVTVERGDVQNNDQDEQQFKWSSPDQVTLVGQTVRYPYAEPRLCKSLSRYIIVNIAAGFAHSLAITDTGALFSCGYNDSGQLGIGSRRNTYQFEQITALDGIPISGIACGQQHSLACSQLQSDTLSESESNIGGVCFAWGLGALGQLGSAAKKAWIPTRVDNITSPVTCVAAGSHHSVAVTIEGYVYTWGHSEYGQHGAGSMYSDLHRGSHCVYPQRQDSLVEEGVVVVSVSCSSHSTFALTSDGRVFSWGWNAFGILGNGKYRRAVRPQVVQGLDDKRATFVEAGADHVGAGTMKIGNHSSLPYYRVLMRKTFCDIVFRVGNGSTEELAHQSIVCARSQYLRGIIRVEASLQNSNSHQTIATNDDARPDQVVSTTPVLVIDAFHDVDPEVFHALLLYLYTNRVEIIGAKRQQLADLADRICHDELEWLATTSWKRKKKNRAIDEYQGSFVKDMQQLVLSPFLADVEFLWPVEGSKENNGENLDGAFNNVTNSKGSFVRLPAHKAVLSQIDYFDKMLSSGFSESAISQLHEDKEMHSQIPMHQIQLQFMQQDGVSLVAFKALLTFIYTGSFDTISSTLEPNEMMDLYVGAGILGIYALGSLCELHLAALLPRLEMESVAACLDFAERFEAKRLKTLCIRILDKKVQPSDQQDAYTSRRGLVSQVDWIDSSVEKKLFAC